MSEEKQKDEEVLTERVTQVPHLTDETWELIQYRIWDKFKGKLWTLVTLFLTAVTLGGLLGLNTYVDHKVSEAIQVEKKQLIEQVDSIDGLFRHRLKDYNTIVYVNSQFARFSSFYESNFSQFLKSDFYLGLDSNQQSGITRHLYSPPSLMALDDNGVHWKVKAYKIWLREFDKHANIEFDSLLRADQMIRSIGAQTTSYLSNLIQIKAKLAVLSFLQQKYQYRVYIDNLNDERQIKSFMFQYDHLREELSASFDSLELKGVGWLPHAEREMERMKRMNK